jgi:hypothetical protein
VRVFKRVVVAALWIYSCAAAGDIAAGMFGTPAVLGVAVGIVAAVFFAVDPLGIVWPKAEPRGLPLASVRASPAAADREDRAA